MFNSPAVMTSCFSSDLIHIENSAGDEQTKKKKDFEMNTRKCKCNTKIEKKYLQTHTDYKLVRSFGFDLIQYNFIYKGKETETQFNHETKTNQGYKL